MSSAPESARDLQVVILAAGTGSRLMPLTRNTPKSLLDLGGGYTLLERQLEATKGCGITDVILVTGYRSSQIEAKVAYYQDFNIAVRFNPFYGISNNIVSAWLGLQGLDGPVVLINGDDVFHPDVLRRLVEADHPVTMMVCRKESYDEDDMKVVTDGPLVRDVGKEIALDVANGDAIGMTFLRDGGLDSFRQALTDRLRDEANLDQFYVRCLKDLVERGFPIRFAECKEDEWAEVDFHPDLDVMRQQVLSGILLKDPASNQPDTLVE